MVRNLINGDVKVEDMLLAHDVDATDLKDAIQDVFADVDILVAIRVLSEMIVEMARQLHGVQMKVVIEPKDGRRRDPHP